MAELNDENNWKNYFFRVEFSVDQCLSHFTQKSDLETLRRDLKDYGLELQTSMSNILKTETEAIVHLAESLTNLNSKIDNLFVPISQLREEIRTLYDLIYTAEFSFSEVLDKLKANNDVRNYIHLKLGLIICASHVDYLLDSNEQILDDLFILERLVNEYSFQKTYVCELNLISTDLAGITAKVEENLLRKVNEKFLFGYNNNDKETISRCLKMYENLQKQDEAQKTFQVQIVRPALSPLFTEKHLADCDNDIDLIYSKVLDFLNNEMKMLNQILIENPELKTLNFVLNSFWKELDKQSREGLIYLTAPGNPELFQKRFTSTYNLLLQIAKQCGDVNLVRENQSFHDHLKRFNLPVYFEIIFQQIAGQFESKICNVDLNNCLAGSNDHNFKVKTTIYTFDSVCQCFMKDIYIDHLADQFIKLYMMIISRYIKWIDTFLQNSQENQHEDFIINTIIDLISLEKLISPDCTSFKDIQNTVFSVINENVWPVMLKVFSCNRKLFSSVRNMLKDKLVKIVIIEPSNHLQSVGSIPRLYRRTNRSPPKEASLYVVSAVKPVVHFHEKFKHANGNIDEILELIISKLAKQYLNLVQDVLMSVCKTEESLRRLKSRNVSSEDTSATQSDTMSDETKIRQQIKIDVTYFLEKLYSLGSKFSKAVMDELKKSIC